MLLGSGIDDWTSFPPGVAKEKTATTTLGVCLVKSLRDYLCSGNEVKFIPTNRSPSRNHLTDPAMSPTTSCRNLLAGAKSRSHPLEPQWSRQMSGWVRCQSSRPLSSMPNQPHRTQPAIVSTDRAFYGLRPRKSLPRRLLLRWQNPSS